MNESYIQTGGFLPPLSPPSQDSKHRDSIRSVEHAAWDLHQAVGDTDKLRRALKQFDQVTRRFRRDAIKLAESNQVKP